MRNNLWGCALLLAFAGHCAAAEITMPPRHALVIGNSAYVSKPLSNPKSDAGLMVKTLAELGFAVTRANDLDRSNFYKTVRGFVDQLPEGSVAVIFYAGHGIQINGSNYLIPVDMTPTGERDVAARAFPVKAILENLERGKSVVNLVVLDACRNNPFLPPSPGKYRSFDGLGLSRVVAPKGTLVAYSTAPGQLAEDGQGRKNSLYTEILSEKLRAPGQTAEGIFKSVADAVRKRTYDDQQPWYETSLVDDFYFIPPDGVQMIAARRKTQITDASRLGATRGIQPNSPWYMALTNQELDGFHREIEQRVKRMTEDEIPGLEHKAKAGNVVAQTTLGIMYREGTKKITEATPVSRSRFEPQYPSTYRYDANNTKSLEWLTMAADAGFPIAQVELGEMYYSGHGVDADKQESLRWFEMASRTNYKRAQLSLMHLKLETGTTGTPTTEDAVNMLNQLRDMMTPSYPANIDTK